MTTAGVLSEAEFVDRARDFLRSRVGDDVVDGLDADSELVRSGVLDSLLVLEFFFFLEELRGASIPEGAVSTEALSSLRQAYRLVVR
jgi:acyl carrier protein